MAPLVDCYLCAFRMSLAAQANKRLTRRAKLRVNISDLGTKCWLADEKGLLVAANGFP